MKKIALYIDEKRYEVVRGTPLEGKLRSMFGGELRVIDIEVDEDLAERILGAFPSARIDARGYIEDLPVAFRKALFEAVISTRDTGRKALEAVLARLEEIKMQAAREAEYLPPP